MFVQMLVFLLYDVLYDVPIVSQHTVECYRI